MPRDPVDAIFALHGIHGAWKVLAATGVANRIYATQDVVLRIATDHPDAVVDARTESVAAPAALEAGVMTPRLIVFDDSRTLIDRPYSIWEHIHADTLGLVELEMNQLEEVWREVGREIGRLHSGVSVCPDPHGYLDTPSREFNLDSVLQRLVDAGHTSDATACEIALLIRDLSPYISRTNSDCFVHNDLHGMNIMCSRTGDLRAILDWGMQAGATRRSISPQFLSIRCYRLLRDMGRKTGSVWATRPKPVSSGTVCTMRWTTQLRMPKS